MKFLLGFGVVLTLFIARLSAADILFLDLNISEPELQGAKTAASARGENLIVYPDLPASNRKSIEQYSSLEVSVHDRLYQISVELEKPDLNTAQLQKLFSEEQSLIVQEEKIRQLREPFVSGYEFKASDLQAYLLTLGQKNVQLTSVILSAHAGVQIFEVLMSELSSSEFTSALDGYQNQSKTTIQSLFLWGCYTATLADLQYWRAAMPTAKMIFGFNGLAPAGIRPASALLLQDALIQEKLLLSQDDPAVIQKTFESLRDLSVTSGGAAILDYYVVNHHKPELLQSQPDCEALISGYTRYQSVYTQYMNAEKGFENPPLDVHNSPLRDYYSVIQQTAGCKLITAQPSAFLGMPSENTILGLIFFENVRKNFGAYFQERITGANTNLKKAGGPGPNEALFPDFSSGELTRAQILSQFSALSALPSLENEVQTLMVSEEAILVNLSCIPFSWMTDEPEPGVMPESPVNCSF